MSPKAILKLSFLLCLKQTTDPKFPAVLNLQAAGTLLRNKTSSGIQEEANSSEQGGGRTSSHGDGFSSTVLLPSTPSNTLSSNFIFNYLICSVVQMFSLCRISYINICRWHIAFFTETAIQWAAWKEHAHLIKCIICFIAIKIIRFSLYIGILAYTLQIKTIFLKSKARHTALAHSEKGLNFYYCLFSKSPYVL